MTENAPLPEWSSRTELAAYLGYFSEDGKPNPRALEHMAYLGTGPRFHRLGHRTVRYRKADVEEWLASCAEPAQAS